MNLLGKYMFFGKSKIWLFANSSIAANFPIFVSLFEDKDNNYNKLWITFF